MIVQYRPATRTTPRSAAGVVLCLCLGLCWSALAPGPAVAADSTSTSDLHGELRATVDSDAVVTLWTDHWVGDRSLLVVTPPWLAGRRRAAASDDLPVLRLTHEGVEHGRRGFSSHADDDGDGFIDEDRLDGFDNDDDGLIDEDFAAVSDQMHVVHRHVGGTEHHLETYHWDYEHLRETLVISWSHDGAPADALLSLPEGAWREARIGWRLARHSALDPSDRAMAVARLTGDRQDWWLGVTVLEGDAVLRMDGGELRLTVGADVVIAVSATSTSTQLRSRMATAHALHAGARSAPDTEPVPWIVPTPVATSADVSPAAEFRTGDDGSLVVAIATPEGWPLLPDPETIRIGGAVLGDPRHVSWTPADGGESFAVDWEQPLTTTALRRAHPLLDLVDAVWGGGEWTFTFPPVLLGEAPESLELTAVCGRTIAVPLRPTPEIVPEAFTASAATEADDEPENENTPSLAPDLLENYPNPFVDFLQIRFKVPQTVGEGFVWEEDEVPLLAPSDPIPYATSQPRVSLKIYNVAGHEVATVFDETCGAGDRTASWNGLDTSGRPVATGTYFCKLQIENWSVTKRVALIR